MSTPATTLIDLADRCEKAEGPDRELDLLIDAACFGRRPWSDLQTVPADEADYYEVPENWTRSAADLVERGTPLMRASHPHGEWALGPNGRVVLKNQNRRVAAKFTASLDAAVTLANGLSLFGGAAGLLRHAMDNMSALPVMLSTMAPDEYAQTLARFFTAACLRALAHNNEGGK